MTSDDELLKRLDNWAQTDMGNVYCMNDCRAAAARIRELEAEVDALKSDLSGYMSAANTYVNELHGVHTGTHVIVPVEPTPEILDAIEDVCIDDVRPKPRLAMPEAKFIYRAMIRAAQEEADDRNN